MEGFFPVACAVKLSKIGLLVRARRLASGIRQSDLKATLGVSEHTLRKIESGSERVDLRSFMLVLWKLGLTETVFASLDGIEKTSEITRFVDEGESHHAIATKRVRLPKSRPEDF